MCKDNIAYSTSSCETANQIRSECVRSIEQETNRSVRESVRTFVRDKASYSRSFWEQENFHTPTMKMLTKIRIVMEKLQPSKLLHRGK